MSVKSYNFDIFKEEQYEQVYIVYQQIFQLSINKASKHALPYLEYC